ncbi:MAG: glutaredoxin domain-containing protein [bacterium]
MSFIRVIRYLLGQLIVGIDALMPVQKIKRSDIEQEKANQQAKNMQLYQFHLCPFCVRVRREIRRLNINIELKDAKKSPKDRDALLSGGGKIKVPCLRIEDSKNTTTWMYESKEINAYLKKVFQS